MLLEIWPFLVYMFLNFTAVQLYNVPARTSESHPVDITPTYLGLTNRYLDNDNNDESRPKNSFLSGSLHFGIKFYCSDEDESSGLCIFLERSYSTILLLIRFVGRSTTVGWD